MRVLCESEVEEVITIEMALAAASACASATAAGKVESARAQVGDPKGWMRALIGILPEIDVLGYKVLLAGRSGGARYACQLFSLSTGEPLGLVDAATITRLRTSAHAALAIDHYFQGSAINLAVIGSGEEARQAVRTIAQRSGLKDVSVWSPRSTSREAFAAQMNEELGIRIRVAETVADCLRSADVAYSATTSGGRVVIEQGDLAGVQMLATIGSTNPRQREIDSAVFEQVKSVVIDTVDCRSDSGDLLEHANLFPDSGTRFSLLGEFLTSKPSFDDGLFVYKSIGSAEQDLYLAYEVLRSVEPGIGV